MIFFYLDFYFVKKLIKNMVYKNYFLSFRNGEIEGCC